MCCQPHIPVNNEWKWQKYSPIQLATLTQTKVFINLLMQPKLSSLNMELSFLTTTSHTSTVFFRWMHCLLAVASYLLQRGTQPSTKIISSIFSYCCMIRDYSISDRICNAESVLYFTNTYRKMGVPILLWHWPERIFFFFGHTFDLVSVNSNYAWAATDDTPLTHMQMVIHFLWRQIQNWNGHG